MNQQYLGNRITTRLTDEEMNKLDVIHKELGLTTRSETLRVLIEAIHQKIKSRLYAKV